MRFLKYLWFCIFGRTETGIFVYWTGQKWSAADPIVVFRGLIDDPEFDDETHCPAMDRGDLNAIGVAARAVRRVFDVPEFSRGGLSERECVELLESYYAFVADLKKSTETPPTSPSPTASAPLVEPSATEPDAACSSTLTEQKCDTQPGLSVA